MTNTEQPTPEAQDAADALWFSLYGFVPVGNSEPITKERHAAIALALDRFAAQRAAEAVENTRPLCGQCHKNVTGYIEDADGRRNYDEFCAECEDQGEPATPLPGDALSGGVPTIEELEALIKPLWLAAKPSREAQAIRSSLSTGFDDPKYRQWIADFIPDYVWDLVDIAAQRGRDSASATLPGDAGERARNIFQEWMRTRPAGAHQASIMASEATRLIEMIAAAIHAQPDPTQEAQEIATALVKLYRTPGEGGIKHNLEDRIAEALTAAASQARREVDAVIEAARELIVGEQPKPFPPTIEELEAILAGDGGRIRIAPSGEVFVRPTLDRLEHALAEYDRVLANPQERA